uniref:Uncharacterized protein n=1 Tax=Panagrolaimus superbus TaxID=310955 RepID=A0A914YSF2_9BILA
MLYRYPPLLKADLNAVVNCTNGIEWILNVFGDCVDTPIKLAGFIIGFISLILWIVGDTCNMIGAILTNQQPLQKIIGVYYICQDVVLFSQYFYYTKVYPRRNQNQGVLVSPIVVPVLLFGTFAGSYFFPVTSYNYAVPSVTGRRLLSSTNNLQMPPIFESYTDAAEFHKFVKVITVVRVKVYRP